MKFSERLSQLGFASYKAYLAADHWQAFRASYRAAGRPMRCAVCDGSPIQLHHHTYVRLGEERLDDVTPLCQSHHKAVHAWLKNAKKFVEHTVLAVASLRGEPFKAKKKELAAASKDFAARMQAEKQAKRKAEQDAQSFPALAARFRELVAEGIKHPAVRPDCQPSLKRLEKLRSWVKWLERAKRRANRPPTKSQPAKKNLAGAPRQEEREASLAKRRAENPMQAIVAAVGTGAVFQSLVANRLAAASPQGVASLPVTSRNEQPANRKKRRPRRAFQHKLRAGRGEAGVPDRGSSGGVRERPYGGRVENAKADRVRPTD